MEASLETAAKNQGRARQPAQRSILIVEDNESVNKALAAVLANANFAVDAFTSGRAALRHVAHSPPDAAVLDIHLPDINGLVLTQRLRELLGPQTPLIILSGDTSMQTLNSLSHVGATYFLPKPVRGADLVGYLREWLEQSKKSEDGR